MFSVEGLTSRNRQEWERLAACEEGTVFHTYDWEELLRLGCGDETPVYWGLFLDGELVAIWPTSVLRAFGGGVLYSLPHSNFGAPVVKDAAVPLWELVGHVSDDAKRCGLLHWSVDVPDSSSVVSSIRSCGFKIGPSPSCTFRLHTTLDVNHLWRGLAGEVRTAVRKARQQGLSVYEATSREEMWHYFGIYQSTMKRRHRKGVSHEFFDLLYDRLLRDRKAMLLLASDRDRVLAGIVLLVHNAKAYWWSGASLEDSWKMRPNELLLWHAIEWASNSGVRSLDLGPTPVEPDSGLNLFKRHFGAERINLLRFTRPIKPLRNFIATTLVTNYRKISKSQLFPESLANWLQSRSYFD